MRVNIVRTLVLLAAICRAAASPQTAANQSSAENQSSPSTQFRIIGTVVDGVTSVPLAKSNVFISPTSDRSRRLSTSSATDGRFVFSDLPPGKYALTGSAKGSPFRPLHHPKHITT